MLLAAFLGGWEILLLFLFPISLLCFAFWIWMLIDCIRSKALSDGEKIAWTLVIVFTHALGALIYLLAGRSPAPGQRAVEEPRVPGAVCVRCDAPLVVGRTDCPVCGWTQPG